jgi:hypothetical protein
MPFHRAIPESKPPAKATSGLGAYVEAEKLLQIAFVLPSAVVIGWLGGALADHLLHQKWIVIVESFSEASQGWFLSSRRRLPPRKIPARKIRTRMGPGREVATIRHDPGKPSHR